MTDTQDTPNEVNEETESWPTCGSGTIYFYEVHYGLDYMNSYLPLQ
jgi:hypothetical protein